jgi:molecular chaperone DnaJ
MARKDYYTVLGVGKNATEEELKRAFREAAKKWHPDRNPGNPEAEQRFREVAEAWEVLGDPEQRARYDRLGPLFTPNGRPPSTEDLNDFVRDTLNGLLGRKKGHRNGDDIKFTATIQLEEAASGCERTLKVSRKLVCKSCIGSGDAKEGRQPCSSCGGSGKSATRRFLRNDCAACDGKGYRSPGRCGVCSGAGIVSMEDSLKVKVPPGVATGQKLKVKGKGDESATGGSSGDLLVILSVEDHPIFRRRGADLLCDAPITYIEAVLGVDLRVPTLDGTTTIRVPPGTPSGRSFRLPGRGMPGLGGSGRGDLHVRVQLEVPANLSAEQRGSLAAFAERLGPDNHPQRIKWQNELNRLAARKQDR